MGDIVDKLINYIKPGSVWIENERSRTKNGNLRPKPRRVRVLAAFDSPETGNQRVRFCTASADGQRPQVCGAAWFAEHFTLQREADNGQS